MYNCTYSVQLHFISEDVTSSNILLLTLSEYQSTNFWYFIYVISILPKNPKIFKNLIIKWVNLIDTNISRYLFFILLIIGISKVGQTIQLYRYLPRCAFNVDKMTLQLWRDNRLGVVLKYFTPTYLVNTTPCGWL